jgi:HEAT repeat protein
VPGGWGKPVDLPPIPWLPRPDNPFSVGEGETVSDPTAWQLWWDVNRDRYLRWANLDTGVAMTGSDSWYLGTGQSEERIGGRLGADLVQGELVPHLVKAIEVGGSNEYVKGALLALGKIGGEENFTTFDFLMRFFLKEGLPELNNTAAFSLGVLADARNLEFLTSLARSGESARELLGKPEVPIEMRAFATYGLGVLGSRTEDLEVRRSIVATLVQQLEDDGPRTNDLQVAAMVAMGLVPLSFDEEAEVCICGECKVEGPDRHYQAQVTYLMRYFTADREFDATVRAHTATTLGRLVAHGQAVAGEAFRAPALEIKEGVADILIEALQRYAKQPPIVQQSAVLALGLTGDADDEEVDHWIRHELGKQAGHGDPLAKRFALMALAEAGSRKGQTEAPWSGTDRTRSELMQILSRGKKNERAWAALALGVFGWHLDQAAQPLEDGVDRALVHAAKKARGSDDLGAVAIALGLRRHADAESVLVQKLGKLKDASAQGHAALALGLMGARDAVGTLQERLGEDDLDPTLQARLGLALGMLGDSSVVETLVERMATSESEDEQAALASALGFLGDRRSLDALAELMLDTEKGYAVSRDKAVLALGFLADAAATPWRSLLAHGCNYRAETPTLTSTDGKGVLDLP